MNTNKLFYKFSGVYFFQYFGIGAFLPLFALYLSSIGLSGVQIGTIMALGSFIGMFSGPFWGYISDLTHHHKRIILVLMCLAIVVVFSITKTKSYGLLLTLNALFYMTFSPLNPLLDGFTLHSPLAFGKIRLWGSVGFAIAAFGIARILNNDNLYLIFYILIVSIVITGSFFASIKLDIDSDHKMNLSELKSLLSNKYFLLFLLYSLLVSSSISGNNLYFGLYYESLGGSLALIGFAFFLFAIGEAPFMQLTPFFLKWLTLKKLLLIAPIMGIIRWFYYASEPSPNMILYTFLIQGLFYAPFLVGAAEYIRTEISPKLRSVAMALYTSVGFGLGGIMSNLVSGYLIDYMSVTYIYYAYTIFCVLATLTVLPIYRKLSRY